jgi:hypothetical protein
MFGEL